MRHTGIEREAAHLTAGQAATDGVVAVAEEVGYSDAFLLPNFLVGSLAQLIDLQMKRQGVATFPHVDHPLICPVLSLRLKC